jgi:hypothetical protein
MYDMSDLVHPYITKENYNKVMILSKVSLGKVSFDKALTVVLESIEAKSQEKRYGI